MCDEFAEDFSPSTSDECVHLKSRKLLRNMEKNANVSIAGHPDELRYTRAMAAQDGKLLEKWLNTRGIATFGRKDFLFGRGRRKNDTKICSGP